MYLNKALEERRRRQNAIVNSPSKLSAGAGESTSDATPSPLESSPSTPNRKMYLNKALSSLEERRRRHNTVSEETISKTETSKLSMTPKKSHGSSESANNTEQTPRRNRSFSPALRSIQATRRNDYKERARKSGTSDEDSIIQLMHNLSAEVSDVMSNDNVNKKNDANAQLTSATKIPIDKAKVRIERGRSPSCRSHSLSRLPIVPKEQEKIKSKDGQRSGCDEIDNSSSDLSTHTEKQRYSRPRSISRLRGIERDSSSSEGSTEQRKNNDQIKTVNSDLSNTTTKLYNSHDTVPKKIVVDADRSSNTVGDREPSAKNDLEKQLEKMKSQLAAEKRTRSQEIQRFERQNMELALKLNEAEKEKAAQLDAEKRTRSQEIQRLERQNMELALKLNDAEKEKAARKENAQRPQPQQEKTHLLRKKNSELQRAVEDYESELEILRNKFDEREDAFESLQDQLELLKTKLHEREDEIEQSRNESNHLRSQIDNTTRDLSEENEALHEQLDIVEDELKLKVNLITDLQEALDQKDEEKNGLKMKIQQMEAIFQRKEEKMKKSVESQLNSLQTDVINVVENLKQEKSQKEHQITILKKKSEEQEQAIENLEEQLANSEAEAQALSETCKKVQMRLDNEISFRQRRFEEIVKETEEAYSAREAKLRTKIEKRHSTELSLRQQQFEDLQKETEKRLSIREDELRSVFKAQVEKLQSFVEDEVQKTEEEGRRALDMARKNWLDELETRLKMTLQDEREKNDRLMKEIQAKETELILLRGEMSTFQSREEEIHQQTSLLLKSLEEAHSRREEDKEQIIRSLNERLQQDQLSMETFSIKVEAKEREMRLCVEEKENIIQCLGERLERNQLAVESLSLSLEAKERKVLEIKAAAADNITTEQMELRLKASFDDELSRLEGEKNRIIQLLDSRLELSQHAMESLSKSLETKNQTIFSYETEIDYLTRRCETLQDLANKDSDDREKVLTDDLQLVREENNKLELDVATLQSAILRLQQQKEAMLQLAQEEKERLEFNVATLQETVAIFQQEKQVQNKQNSEEDSDNYAANVDCNYMEMKTMLDLLQEEKKQLEFHVSTLQETVAILQQQKHLNDKLNPQETPNKNEFAGVNGRYSETNPHAAIDQLLTKVPVKDVIKYLHAYISGQTQIHAEAEVNSLLNKYEEQEKKVVRKTDLNFLETALNSHEMLEDISKCDTNDNCSLEISTIRSSESANSDFSSTKVAEISSNLVFMSSSRSSDSDFFKTTKKFIGKELGMSSSTDSELSETNVTEISAKELFMTAPTPRAKPVRVNEPFMSAVSPKSNSKQVEPFIVVVTPKGSSKNNEAAKANSNSRHIDFVEDKIRSSAITMWKTMKKCIR